MRTLHIALMARAIRPAMVALALGLAACTPEDAPPVAYQDRYPIRVEMKAFSVTVPVAAVKDARPVPRDFLNEYRRRGRGPITIVLPETAPPETRSAAAALGHWLDRRGIAATAVRGAGGVGPAADDELQLFFKAYVAKVGECGFLGTAESASAATPRNALPAEYGCAVQRNIGLMLSDPGDLIRAKPTGPMDAARATGVINKYREGKATGTERPSQEKGAFSAVQGY